MKRFVYDALLKWQRRKKRKPLILEGARQVGKTYLLKAFGKAAYQDYLCLNFEEMPELKSIFAKNLEPTRLVKDLSLALEKPIAPENTLIIFDEIQACPNALNSLKYFYEKLPNYHICAAGSLLGIALNNRKSFPVGKVHFLKLYPLSFAEFLQNAEKTSWVEHLGETTTAVSEPIHNKLMQMVKEYLFVGGMPEAVAAHLEGESFDTVREIQQDILKAYFRDFAKHAPASDVIKLTEIFESIPMHLGKENKKFIFSAIHPSARAREYASALQWLKDAGLILKTHCVEKPEPPLSSYQTSNAFKVYLLDVGLLSAMSRVRATQLVGENLLTEYKGALTENFVAQEFTTTFDEPLYYWTSDGKAEVDFVLDTADGIVPVEVKAGNSVRSKSLSVFRNKYDTKQAVRISGKPFERQSGLLNLPHYLIAELSRLCALG